MLVIKQLLAGVDFAQAHPSAGQWANFAYVVGDDEGRECVLVDPTWDVSDLIGIAEEAGFKVVGAIATHGHADHTGGRLFGTDIEGLDRLLELRPGIPVYVHELDAAALSAATGLSGSALRQVKDGEHIRFGGQEAVVIHTPGHTPGGMCLRVGGAVLTGDTLFVGECGRVDLPVSQPREMGVSLLDRLGALPDETVVYPGHDYGRTRTSTIGEEKRTNPNYKLPREVWDRIGS